MRHLGTSNVTVPKLRLILGDARIRPSLNEMELHPCFQQPELFDLCVAEGVQPVGYSPLGSPSRPERDRTPGDHVDTEHPAVVAAAQAHGDPPGAGLPQVGRRTAARSRSPSRSSPSSTRPTCAR